jgi:ABC-type multidrug transport system ATPase subunit
MRSPAWSCPRSFRAPLWQTYPKCTVFFSSHILADVDRICDEVAILHRSHLIVQSTTQELKEQYARPVITIEREKDASMLPDLLQQETYVQKNRSDVHRCHCSSHLPEQENQEAHPSSALTPNALPFLIPQIAPI